MLGMRVFYKIKKVGLKKIWNEIQKDKKNVIFVIYIPIFLLLIGIFLPKVELPEVKDIDIDNFEKIMNKNKCHIDNISNDKEQTYIVNESSQCLYNIKIIKYSNIEEATEKFNSIQKNTININLRNKGKYMTDTYHNFYEYKFEGDSTAVLTQNRNVLLYAETTKADNVKFYNMLYEIGGHYKIGVLLNKQYLIVYIVCFIMFIDVVYILIFIYTKILKIDNKDDIDEKR